MSSLSPIPESPSAQGLEVRVDHEPAQPLTSPHPSTRSLVLAVGLFLLTLYTCLAAGRQFAVAYANNEAVSMEEFVRSLTMLYKNPAGLWAGWPFAVTLLSILLVHEFGHYFACRHHHIRSSYPFFLPAPTLIGTLGAFILIRSRIQSNRALFDVGASGPLVGFLLAIPALAFGVWHGKVVPGLADDKNVAFAIPVLLKWFAQMAHPGVAPGTLLLHPVGRAAWVGLFATSLNLLPAGQLDGGHILRSLSVRAHRYLTMFLPALLVLLGYFLWWVWYVFAGVLFGLQFLRASRVSDAEPLDAARVLLALATVVVFLLCFMPAPILNL